MNKSIPNQRVTGIPPSKKRTQTLHVPASKMNGVTPLAHEKILPGTNAPDLDELLQDDNNQVDHDYELKKFEAAVTAVFNPNNINLKAVLRPDQVPLVIRCMAWSWKYERIDNEFRPGLMAKTVRDFLELSVSGMEGRGTGRKNLVEILRAFLVNRPEDSLGNETKNNINRLIG